MSNPNLNGIWIVRDGQKPNIGMVFTSKGERLPLVRSITVEISPDNVNSATVNFLLPNFANTIEEMNDAIRIMKANEFEASIREGKIQ